jgi:hypothetical protein
VSARTRFAQCYLVTETGCWQWQRPLDNGYGRFWVDGQTVLAHRYSYEIHVGSIPDGLHLDHLCRNRGCVNPAHLEPVTLAVNVLRGEGLSAVNARKTVCKHGHPLTDDNVYVTPRGSRTCRACQRARVVAWRERRSA